MRIVRSTLYLGAEATITGLNIIADDHGVLEAGCIAIAIDGVRAEHPSGAYGVDVTQIEPILPEGWKPVEWSACLWSPEGLASRMTAVAA